MKDFKSRALNSRYIIYTLIIGFVISLLYRKYYFSGEFIVYSGLIIILGIATIVDIRKMIIPNKLLIIGLFASIISMFINRDIAIVSSILGGIVSGGVLLGLAYLTKGGIGLGDTKLIAVIGLFVGIVNVFNILMISTIFSGILSIILLSFKIRGKKDSLPFAPFILMGTVFVLLIN